MAKKAKSYKYSEGIGDLLDGLVNLERQYPEINRYAVNLIALKAVELAKTNIEGGGDPSEPHSKYTAELTKKLRGGTTRDPLVEDGELKDSIRVTMNTVAGGNFYVEIGSNKVYAAILEYGGNPGGAVGKIGPDGKRDPFIGYIPPRPYLRPAITQAIWEAIGGGLERQIANAYDLAVQKKNWHTAFTGF